MKSWFKFLILFGFVSVLVAGGVILGLLIIASDDNKTRNSDDEGNDEVVYPDTLPLGESPQLAFLFNSCSFDNINQIGDFGPDHNGIDFNVNDSSVVLCPHDAYVSDIRFYENEYGNHWQTNVRIRLNSK